MNGRIRQRYAMRSIDLAAGDNPKMARDYGRVHSVRRLKLRPGYRDEDPHPTFLSLKILIDGEEVLMWAGPDGPYIGLRASALLGEDSPLIPAEPPRRIALYSEGVPDPDESTITAVVSASDAHVVWSDFLECLVDSGDSDSDHTVVDLHPTRSRSIDVPDLIFDRQQYLAEVWRGIAAREWESDPWRTAQLLDDYLSPGRPWSIGEDFYPSYAEPANDDGAAFLVTLWDVMLVRRVVVSLTAAAGTPEQRARSMADQLMKTPTDQWPVVRRTDLPDQRGDG